MTHDKFTAAKRMAELWADGGAADRQRVLDLIDQYQEPIRTLVMGVVWGSLSAWGRLAYVDFQVQVVNPHMVATGGREYPVQDEERPAKHTPPARGHEL